MLALVLGFKEKGSNSPVEVLYAGRSASDANWLADNPPPGIVRTETLKNPITHHRRHFPDNLAVEELGTRNAERGMSEEAVPASEVSIPTSELPAPARKK